MGADVVPRAAHNSQGKQQWPLAMLRCNSSLGVPLCFYLLLTATPWSSGEESEGP